MSKPFDSIATRLLRRLARAVCARPGLFLYPQILIFLFGVGFTIKKLQFDTSRDNLVGSDKEYHQNFLKFKTEFPTQDDLVVVVESELMEKNRQFVERLGARLEAETNLFADVIYKGDLKMLGPKALLFVPENDLKELQKTLRDFRPFIEQFTQATNLNSLFTLINKRFRTARQEENEENKALIKAMPALERIIVQASQSLKRPGSAPSPGLNALFGAGDEAERKMYITFAQGRIYLVTTRAAKGAPNGKAVERLRELVQQTQFEVPGLNVGITGEPVLEFDEMAQSQFDSTVASIVSLVACALIFIFGYSQTGRPLKATLCLVVGLGYTMFYTTATVGHLNILTITFVPILIGLAIDFGVHLITRYEEELRHGKSQNEAMELAMVNTGIGIFTGAFTTSGAFFAMALTNFKGIQEMGIICGGGMLLCLVPMMTMLPVLLLQGRQNVIDAGAASPVDHRARIENLWLRRPVLVVAVTLVLCALAVAQFRKVYFDYNLLNMQSRGLPAVVLEHTLIDTAEKSVLFGAMAATNLDHLAELKNKVLKLPTVASVDPIAEFVTDDQSGNLALVQQIKTDVSSIHFAAMDPEPVDVPELSQTFWALQGYVGLAAEFSAKDDAKLSHDLLSIRSAIVDFKALLWQQSEAVPQLTKFQNALFTDIHDTFDALKNQDATGRIRAADLPPALRNRFVGVTGKYLLQVYPKKDVWQRDNQKEFVRELRTVDPNVTGTPVQLYEYTTLLKDSYQEAAWYALGAIAILVFIHFHSLSAVILALLPVGIGAAWMVGLMGYFDIPFNPANIMTLPLVIGIGVTNGIHILNRFVEERTPAILGKSTGKAVLVSGMTTMAGFGSLILAKHQGIASLGFVMTVGVTTCMMAALTFLPALLNLLMRTGWNLKKPGSENAQSPPGSEEPR